MELSIIVAVTTNNAIGRGGDLLYHISDDLRYFKSLTTGHPIIMGRRTFESFPKGALPNRRNMVLSRHDGYNAPGAEVFPDLDSALKAIESDETEAFVIGGGQVYAQALDRATRLYITHIDTTVTDADTYFPDIDTDTWATHTLGDWQTDPRTGLRFRFAVYHRIQWNGDFQSPTAYHLNLPPNGTAISNRPTHLPPNGTAISNSPTHLPPIIKKIRNFVGRNASPDSSTDRIEVS